MSETEPSRSGGARTGPSSFAKAAVAGLFVLLYLVPLGIRPLSAPDEYRYAEISREMRVTGDWVVPRLVGLDYFEKPVLGYWLMAGSSALLGPSAFSLRLPAALATGLMALGVGWLLARASGNATAGLLAAAATLTSVLPYTLGNIAILDAPFALFVTAGMVLTFLAMEDRSPRAGLLAAAGASLGLAVLTKGPLGLVLPAVVLLPYLAWIGSLGRFLRRAWVPAVAAAAVVLPWAVAVALRADFWHRFLWVEHVVRFLEPGTNQHPEAWWYYLPHLFLAVMPWWALLPAAMAGRGERRPDGPVARLRLFAALWLVVPLLLLSASSGKRATYLLPLVPAAVLLLVEPAMLAVRRRGPRALVLPAALVASGTAVLLAGGIAATRWSEPVAAAAAANPAGWALLGGAAIASLACGLLALRGSPARRLTLLVAAPALLFLGVHPVLDHDTLSAPDPRMTAGLREHPEARLVSDKDCAPAVAWITGRTDVELFDDAGELAYGLQRTPDRSLVETPRLRAMVEAGGPLVMLVGTPRWEYHAPSLPVPDRIIRGTRMALIIYGSPDVALAEPGGREATR